MKNLWLIKTDDAYKAYMGLCACSSKYHLYHYLTDRSDAQVSRLVSDKVWFYLNDALESPVRPNAILRSLRAQLFWGIQK
jgi:hypothetical protein